MEAILQQLLNVRRTEWVPVLLSALFFFCVLAALMVLRPAREALGLERGIEAVRWLFVATALITLLVNPGFGWLASRLRRWPLILTVYLFFAGSLLVFHGLLVAAPAAVGVVSGQVFYVWFSVFNLFSTMVFWALMVDRFSLEQGKRCFGVIAVGGTLGAIAGPWLAGRLAVTLGTPALLWVSALFLLAALGFARGLCWTDRAPGDERRSVVGAASSSSDRKLEDSGGAALGGRAWEGLRAVVRSPYLAGVAGYMVLLAVMATFLYFTRLQMVAGLEGDTDGRTALFAHIDLITQIATLLLQLLVTGHLMKRVGVSVALVLLPLTAMLGFVGLAVAGSLAALILFEGAFRSVQRAIMRPARETLFTVVDREDKYKAKAFIDTFVYRAGDVAGAQLEGVLGRLATGLAALAAIAVPLALAWALLGAWLARAQHERAAGAPDRGTGRATAAQTGNHYDLS